MGERKPPPAFIFTGVGRTTKDPAARAGRVGGAPAAATPERGFGPSQGPALTVPVAQLNGLQAEVFDHLLTWAGGAVEGMLQARHLHFPNPFLKPAIFVSRLSRWTVWEIRAGKGRGVVEGGKAA